MTSVHRCNQLKKMGDLKLWVLPRVLLLTPWHLKVRGSADVSDGGPDEGTENKDEDDLETFK